MLTISNLEHKVGFEPTNKGFAVPAIRPLWYLCILYIKVYSILYNFRVFCTLYCTNYCLAPVERIELPLTVLETAALPLYYTGIVGSCPPGDP